MEYGEETLEPFPGITFQSTLIDNGHTSGLFSAADESTFTVIRYGLVLASAGLGERLLEGSRPFL